MVIWLLTGYSDKVGFVCDQWFSDQLVDGSMLGCWLQVAGDLVIYWLPGYLLLVTELIRMVGCMKSCLHII